MNYRWQLPSNQSYAIGQYLPRIVLGRWGNGSDEKSPKGFLLHLHLLDHTQSITYIRHPKFSVLYVCNALRVYRAVVVLMCVCRTIHVVCYRVSVVLV